jgi:hypothetical protein
VSLHGDCIVHNSSDFDVTRGSIEHKQLHHAQKRVAQASARAQNSQKHWPTRLNHQCTEEVTDLSMILHRVALHLLAVRGARTWLSLTVLSAAMLDVSGTHSLIAAMFRYRNRMNCALMHGINHSHAGMLLHGQHNLQSRELVP